MTALTPQRLTAMYHAQLEDGAVMADTDGWQLPVHYGRFSQESRWLRESVGVSDVSPIGKVRVVGRDAAQTVAALLPEADDSPVGSVSEADSPLERGGKLLAVRLAQDEFLVLTPAGEALSAIDAMQSGNPDCAHSVDVTSGLCGVAIVGPSIHHMMGRITEVDTSPRDLPDLTAVQSRFAEVQAMLLRRDVNGIAMYQLYASREFGEYLWETLVETARELHGGPVGTQASWD